MILLGRNPGRPGNSGHNAKCVVCVCVWVDFNFSPFLKTNNERKGGFEEGFGITFWIW